MYNSIQFHSGDLSRYSFLITGGAGFIGSNITEYLLAHGAGSVHVLDNLSEGKIENIKAFEGMPNFHFEEADIVDPQVCLDACKGIDFVCHQAALGSVPRSIDNPIATNHANVTGFLNLLTAAKDSGVKRFVFASSSSVYGDSPVLPKVENQIGKPLSPYAASKLIDEIYADVFSRNYGLEYVGLRYFNVYGPRQKPDGPYAAVIPLFMQAMLDQKSPRIFGDGEQSRDFTFVADAVQANIRSMLGSNSEACGKIYNVAFGQRTTVNQLFQTIAGLSNSNIEPIYAEARKGDVLHSLADVSQARTLIEYSPDFDLEKGLELTLKWFVETHGSQPDTSRV